MKIGAGMCFALVMTGATPLAAQMCQDDISGITMDEKGDYVVKAPGTNNAMSARANVSRAPRSGAPASSVSKETTAALKQFFEKLKATGAEGAASPAKAEASSSPPVEVDSTPRTLAASSAPLPANR